MLLANLSVVHVLSVVSAWHARYKGTGAVCAADPFSHSR